MSGQYVVNQPASEVRTEERNRNLTNPVFFYSGLSNRLIAIIATYLNISNNDCRPIKVVGRFFTFVRSYGEQLYVNMGQIL